jgi:hypothetical protein
MGGKAMRRVFTFLILCAFYIALTANGKLLAQAGGGGSPDSAKSQSAEQNKADKDSARKNIMGYLHTRDKIIAISRGENGTVYTIKTKDGKTLATNINEKDLQAKYPDIYRQVREGRAANDASIYKNSRVPR